MENSVTQSILVVGGGMAGMTAAIEAAEAGYEVILVEKNPYLGGRVAQLNKYFPKLCPPVLRLGDKLQAHQTEQKGPFLHHGRSAENIGLDR